MIETRNLVKVYKEGHVKAVDGLNLNIRRGEIYALIGANGSGKTTTINMLTGALLPSSGSITVLGREMPKHRHELTPRIGVSSTGVFHLRRPLSGTERLVLCETVRDGQA